VRSLLLSDVFLEKLKPLPPHSPSPFILKLEFGTLSFKSSPFTSPPLLDVRIAFRDVHTGALKAKGYANRSRLLPTTPPYSAGDDVFVSSPFPRFPPFHIAQAPSNDKVKPVIDVVVVVTLSALGEEKPALEASFSLEEHGLLLQRGSRTEKLKPPKELGARGGGSGGAVTLSWEVDFPRKKEWANSCDCGDEELEDVLEDALMSWETEHRLQAAEREQVSFHVVFPSPFETDIFLTFSPVLL
jgi:hypothetical protein